MRRLVCNLFPSAAITGKEFRDKRRDKKSSVSKFRFLGDNSFEGGQTVLDDWDHRVRKIQCGAQDPVNGTAASLQLPSACGGLFYGR